MKALLKIEWIQIWRNWPIFIMDIGLPVMFFLLISASMGTNTPTNQQIIQEYLFKMTAFSMSSFALFSFPVMLKEDRSNHYLLYIEHSPLKIGQYYLAKFIRILIYFLLSIVVTFLVGIFLRGVHFSLASVLLSGGFLLLSSLVYLAFGGLIAQISDNQKMSMVSNITFLGLAIIGGAWWPIEVFPKWLQTIAKITPTYQVNQVVIQIARKATLAKLSLLILLVYVIITTVMVLLIHRKREVV